MTPRTIRLPLLLTALVLLAASQARAEMIDFSYQWTVQPSVITGGIGVVTISAAPNGTSSVELGSSTPSFIPGATITTNTTAENPEPFSTPYNMKLHLTDITSGQSGDLTFSGSVSGTLSATQSTLTSTFNEPFTQSLTLGGRIYSVTISPVLANLPLPGSPAPVLLDARVTANKVIIDPPPIGTPEPSTLLLGTTAVLGLAARRFLRRRQSAQSV